MNCCHYLPALLRAKKKKNSSTTRINLSYFSVFAQISCYIIFADVILDVSSGTGSNSVHSMSSPDDPPWLVSYPHFLFPPSHKEIPIALASHRPAIDHSQSFYSYNISIPEMGTSTNLEHEHRKDHDLRKHNSDEKRPHNESKSHASRWRQDNRYESGKKYSIMVFVFKHINLSKCSINNSTLPAPFTHALCRNCIL